MFKTHLHTHLTGGLEMMLRYTRAPWSLPFPCAEQVVTRVSLQYRLAESGLRVPACASLLSGMETSPSQGVEVPMLADQDFEDMFLADTQARLGKAALREHDHVASLPSTI